jgi:GntR family transcriptional regulator / MocR family aminotransferase
LSSAVPPISIVLDRSSAVPLHHQLYEHLRDLILSGQLDAGSRLPSTRTLATDLEVSRTTVIGAYERLAGEGYIEGRLGAGTTVSRVLPPEPGQVEPIDRDVRRRIHSRERLELSRRGVELTAVPHLRRGPDAPKAADPAAFRPGVPALDAFPRGVWARLVARAARRCSSEMLGYQNPAGYLPLRQAIATYVGVSRGVRCTADQVVIVAGSQEGLALTAQMTLDPGDSAWIEEPGYLGARAAFIGAGARLTPVPLDGDGIDVAAGLRQAPDARLCYVTPANQCPMGTTMSLARRLALLEWARKSQAWILEDDYDSEYRYLGAPVPALRSLDEAGRVIYLGTFSKVMFPDLRVGYLIVPRTLAGAFRAGRLFLSRQSPSIEQVALCAFISQGHFGRHIRRMRALYAERRARLLELLQRELGDLLTPAPGSGGMHMVAWLPRDLDDVAVSYRARRFGIETLPLSHFCLNPPWRPGLMLGFSNVPSDEMERGVAALKRALRSLGAAGAQPA